VVTIIFREVVFPLNSSNSEPQKHINFTPEQIKAYLTTFKKLVLEDKYTIAKNENRNENTEFMENYKIDTKKEKEILLSLEFDDFCYAVDNKKPKYAHEQLYVFCKTRDLDNWGVLRAKFKCSSYNNGVVIMHPVYSGSEENKAFWR
jgi:hypothetical protein